MTREEIIQALKDKGLKDILELVEDAEEGELEELELVESIGLVHDETLNREVISLLQILGVKMIYVTDEEDEQ
jgi:hypothetical protein